MVKGREWIATIVGLGLITLIGSVDPSASSSADSIRNDRFTILEHSHQEAVLDLTTQLIWERMPFSSAMTWTTANARCALKVVGGQTGWRLPSFIELMTLVEPTSLRASTEIALPPGHPFLGISMAAYWTNNTLATEPAQAYTVDFLRADVAPHQKDQIHPLWCVRAGMANSLKAAPATLVPPLI